MSSSSGTSPSKRRWLVPTIVQTSAMDCGPATLCAALQGFGIPANYGRLREACQTHVDGTSIDVMEDVAIAIGVDAEQMLIPPEHLFLDDGLLPAITVTFVARATHFVVAWRRVG